jgi:polyhydroxybutyrate depolymerase
MVAIGSSYWLAACGASLADDDSSSGGGAPSGSGGKGSGGTVTGGAGPGGTPTGGTGNGGAGNGGTGSGGGASGGASGAGASGGSGGGEALGGSAGTGGTGGSDPAPCPASATLTAGDTTTMIMVDGTERSFLVHVPPGYDGTTRVPIVFDFHGLGGNSNQQKNLSRWDDVADTQGFVVVYPQGLENAWNAGLCCSDGSDDVAFVRAIIQTLQTEACIDAKRVYASGCSNGGGMSYKLACDAADVITGVAPVDFDCVDGAGCGDCSPSRPVPVVQFRGTNDTLVPYEGSGAFSGARANFSNWGEINMCAGAAQSLAQHAGCETYPMCSAAAETILCTVQNGTHCGSYGSFMIAEVAWDVLQHHALP